MRSLEQQTILITGATDGLGRCLARELAGHGASLILHGRSAAKGFALVDELRAETGNDRLRYVLADFASLAETHCMADELLDAGDRLDVLVNNAGVGVGVDRRSSRDGLELTFQVNYLATYILSCRLAPLLIRSAPARLVNVASAGQAPVDHTDVMLEHRWDATHAYRQSKLAQIMLTFDLAPLLMDAGVSVNALHPATFMPTKIVTHLFTPQSTLAEGTYNTLRLITDPELADTTGTYFDHARPGRAHEKAYDPAARARLRELSEKLTGVAFPQG